MNSVKRVALTAMMLGLVGSGSVCAANLVATVVDAKGGRGQSALALDINTNGEAAGFSFRVQIPGLKPKSVDLSKCAADLPAAFGGKCSVVGDSVFFWAMSMSPDVSLPKGLISIGTITFSRDLPKDGGGAIRIEDVTVSNQLAQRIDTVAEVASDAREGTGNVQQK